MNTVMTFIDIVQQIVKDHLSDSNLNGAFVANKLGMSRMQLHRRLKTQCGKNSSSFINSIRIEVAKEQLAYSNDSIQVIAEKVGFASTPYFCKIFKAEIGITPSQYRSRYA